MNELNIKELFSVFLDNSISKNSRTQLKQLVSSIFLMKKMNVIDFKKLINKAPSESLSQLISSLGEHVSNYYPPDSNNEWNLLDELIHELIENGAQPFEKNKSKESVLKTLALMNCNKALKSSLKLMEKSQIDALSITSWRDFNNNKTAFSPLSYITKYCFCDTIELFLKHGLKDNPEMNSPYFFIRTIEDAKLLNKYQINPWKKSKNGLYPIRKFLNNNIYIKPAAALKAFNVENVSIEDKFNIVEALVFSIIATGGDIFSVINLNKNEINGKNQTIFEVMVEAIIHNKDHEVEMGSNRGVQLKDIPHNKWSEFISLYADSSKKDNESILKLCLFLWQKHNYDNKYTQLLLKEISKIGLISDYSPPDKNILSLATKNMAKIFNVKEMKTNLSILLLTNSCNNKRALPDWVGNSAYIKERNDLMDEAFLKNKNFYTSSYFKNSSLSYELLTTIKLANQKNWAGNPWDIILPVLCCRPDINHNNLGHGVNLNDYWTWDNVGKYNSEGLLPMKKYPPLLLKCIKGTVTPNQDMINLILPTFKKLCEKKQHYNTYYPIVPYQKMDQIFLSASIKTPKTKKQSARI